MILLLYVEMLKNRIVGVNSVVESTKELDERIRKRNLKLFRHHITRAREAFVRYKGTGVEDEDFTDAYFYKTLPLGGSEYESADVDSVLENMVWEADRLLKK